MKLTLLPTRSDDMLALSKSGDRLTINGLVFDFAQLTEGAELPVEAVVSDWIAGPVRREDGALHLSLVLPHGKDAPESTTFPAPMTLTSDGPVSLPAYAIDADGQEVHGALPSVSAEGMIDWSQMTTPESRAEAALAEWRATAHMPRAEFAIAAAQFGLVTEEEAEEWAAGTALPEIVKTTIADALPPEAQLSARITARTQTTIGREADLIPLLAAAKGLTEAEVDALFGWPG